METFNKYNESGRNLCSTRKHYLTKCRRMKQSKEECVNDEVTFVASIYAKWKVTFLNKEHIKILRKDLQLKYTA